MSKKKIDLSDIKDDELEKTSSFTDLMTRKERKRRTKKTDIDIEISEDTESNIDIEEMISEKKRSTADLTKDLEEAQEEFNKVIKEDKNEEENDKLEKTQILELTRQMKFNFEEKKKKNNEHKKKFFSPLNVIGEVNLLCIGYYIYLLVFTDYQDSQETYMMTGGIIVLLVLLFGLSVVTGKRLSKFFNVLNILAIFAFIIFCAYNLIN